MSEPAQTESAEMPLTVPAEPDEDIVGPGVDCDAGCGRTLFWCKHVAVVEGLGGKACEAKVIGEEVRAELTEDRVCHRSLLRTKGMLLASLISC